MQPKSAQLQITSVILNKYIDLKRFKEVNITKYSQKLLENKNSTTTSIVGSTFSL
jgi:hypothetical protein